MKVEIKRGKELSGDELLVINEGRQREFASKDPIKPVPSNVNWEAVFFLVKADMDQVLAFGKLHAIEVIFQGVTYPVWCISTLVSLDKGKGYGRRILKEMENYLRTQEETALGFCETELLSFYQKCGVEFLTKEDNQFFYVTKNGKQINDPNIVPGEVIFIWGKDGLMEKIMASKDKRVGVID